MNKILPLILALGLMTSPGWAKSKSPERVSAYEALREAQKNLRPDISNNICEMRGQAGKPHPRLWEVIVFDPKEDSKKIVLDMTGRELKEERRPLALFDEPTKNDLIDLKRLRLDSHKAFKIVQEICQKENNLIASKADFVLKKPTRKPGVNPVWYITVYDAQDHHLGNVVISAYSGKILKTEKLVHQGKKAKTFTDEVEEFFTGKDEDDDKKPAQE